MLYIVVCNYILCTAAHALRRKELERYARFTSLVSGTLVAVFGFAWIMYCKMTINAAEEESVEVLYLYTCDIR